MAFSSDTILDIIPADTAAYLIISAGAAAAATYGSLCADRSSVIFHAAASESSPLAVRQAFEALSSFWKANPPPVTLPAARYAWGSSPVQREHVDHVVLLAQQLERFWGQPAGLSLHGPTEVRLLTYNVV